MKRKIYRVLLISLLVIQFTLPVSADYIEKTATPTSKAWERYATGDGGKASLTYGYNTFLVNEDYAWAKHTTKSHYSSLENANGWHNGPFKNGGQVSKIEVVHKSGLIISYYNFW